MRLQVEVDKHLAMNDGLLCHVIFNRHLGKEKCLNGLILVSRKKSSLKIIVIQSQMFRMKAIISAIQRFYSTISVSVCSVPKHHGPTLVQGS